MLYINIQTGRFAASPGNNLPFALLDRDALIHGAVQTLHLQLLNPDGTPVALDAADTWALGIDVNFLHNDDLIAYSGAEKFVVADAASGRLDVEVDCTPASFGAKITARNTPVYCQLKRFAAGDAVGETVLLDTLPAQPAVWTTEGAPDPGAPGYYTAEQIRALLAAELPFRGVYSTSSAYAEGDVVICDGSLWETGMDVAAGEDYPEDASAVWSCVLAGSRFRDDYDAAATYAAGDYVVSGGALWRCELDNPTEAPSADSAEWSLVVGGGTSGGGTAALPLAMTPAVVDTNYDIVGYLDSDCTVLTGATRVHGITKLHIWCVAANPASSGNLELEVSCGSVSQTVELPVSGTETMQTIELSAAATGTLTLTRTIGGAMETFPADVTAIVTGVLYE